MIKPADVVLSKRRIDCLLHSCSVASISCGYTVFPHVSVRVKVFARHAKTGKHINIKRPLGKNCNSLLVFVRFHVFCVNAQAKVV